MGTPRIARPLCRSPSKHGKESVFESEHFPRYQKERRVNSLLELFEVFIKENFLIRKQKISVIFDNIASKGFAGSRISLYRYIAEHLKAEGEKGKIEAYMLYETLPGEHMLYDWAEYRVTLGCQQSKVYVHATELGFSRYIVLSVSLTIRQAEVFEALEDAFEKLGGVAPRLQVDNARVFVDDAAIGNLKWNAKFLEL